MKGSDRCPHCGHQVATEPHPTLRYRCRICGGPRIFDAGGRLPLSGREQQFLKSANSSKRLRLALLVAAFTISAFGFLAFLTTAVVWLIVQPGAVATTLLLAMLLVPALLGYISFSRANKQKRRLADALDAAWLMAALDTVQAEPRAISSKELSQILGVDEDLTDQLLTRLSVDNQVWSKITGDGEIVYAAGPAERMRVAELDTEASELESTTQTTQRQPERR